MRLLARDFGGEGAPRGQVGLARHGRCRRRQSLADSPAGGRPRSTLAGGKAHLGTDGGPAGEGHFNSNHPKGLSLLDDWCRMDSAPTLRLRDRHGAALSRQAVQPTLSLTRRVTRTPRCRANPSHNRRQTAGRRPTWQHRYPRSRVSNTTPVRALTPGRTASPTPRPISRLAEHPRPGKTYWSPHRRSEDCPIGMAELTVAVWHTNDFGIGHRLGRDAR